MLNCKSQQPRLYLPLATLILFLGMTFCFSNVVVAEEPVKISENKPDTSSLKVASISFVPVKWDKQKNAQRLVTEIRKAAKAGAELVITPEGMLEGYVVNEVIHEQDLMQKAELTKRFQELAEPIEGPYFKQFQTLAHELNIYLILGFLERDAASSKTFNSAALIGPDGNLVGKYHKTHFHQGYKVNPPGYTAGNEYPVFSIQDLDSPNKINLGMMICFDRQLPEPARQLTLNGADLIVCPAYGSWGKWNTRLMQVRAYENQAYVVFSHPKQSLLIDRDGEIMQEGAENSFAITDIDLLQLKKTRRSVNNRRPETYQQLQKTKSSPAP